MDHKDMEERLRELELWKAKINGGRQVLFWTAGILGTLIGAAAEYFRHG